MKNFIEIIDLKTGKKSVHQMHSFTRQYLAVLHEFFGFNRLFYAKQTDGSMWAYPYPQYLNPCAGGSGVNDLGIVLGTGNTPGNSNDYKLETIANMAEESTCFVNATTDENFERITIERYFENTTETDVIVKEVGIYCHGKNTNYRIMICRDVLQTPETWGPNDRKLVKIHLGFEDNFTINWQFLHQYRLRGSSGELKNMSGTWKDSACSPTKLYAGLNVKNYGILIGSGSTTPTINDYCLENPQSTNWIYSAITLHSVVTAGDGSYTRMIIKRDFTNNTGSTITIREAAIVVGLYIPQAYDGFQIARYVFDAVQVQPDQVLTITWSFTVPMATYNPPENPSQ